MDPGPSGLKEDRGSNLSGRPRLRLWGPGLGGRRGGWGAGWGQRQASLGKHPRDSLAEHKSGPLQFFDQLCRRHGITAQFLPARSFSEMAVLLNRALIAKYPNPVMSPPASAPPASAPPAAPSPPAAASALSAVKAAPEPEKEEPCAADSAPASVAEELGAASAADEAAANAAPLGAAASVAEDLGAASAADEARELIYVRTYPPPPAPPPNPKLKGFRAWEGEIYPHDTPLAGRGFRDGFPPIRPPSSEFGWDLRMWDRASGMTPTLRAHSQAPRGQF